MLLVLGQVSIVLALFLMYHNTPLLKEIILFGRDLDKLLVHSFGFLDYQSISFHSI